MAIDVPVAAVDVRREDIDAVVRVLASGNLRQGEVVAEFEEAFAARVGARHAVAVSSGTAALHLAYLAHFNPGDEVIVPAFTFVATASMLLAVGAKPVLADVDPRTFNLSVEDARSRVSERTRGIVGVHLFGDACDMDGLAALADNRGLHLVYDAAQALGTQYRGRDVGSFGRTTCYSFYPTKTITTGEGGMVVTDDDDVASALRLSRSQGAEGKYLHTTLGYNYRLTDFQGALGRSQLSRLDEALVARRHNAEVLTTGLHDVNGIRPPGAGRASTHSFNQYSVLVDDELLGLSRDELASRLNRAGVGTAVHYPRPLHHQPVLRSQVSLPVSEDLCQRILALPVHPGLSARDLEHVATSLREVVSGGVVMNHRRRPA